MDRKVLLTLIFLAIACLCEDYEEIEVTKYMVAPQVVRQKVPQKYFNKYISEGFATLLDQVSFQSSAYFYMKEGALSGDDAYNPYKFGGHDNRCRIYKTDVKMMQYREIAIQKRPIDISVAFETSTKIDRVATVYTLYIGGLIQVSEVFKYTMRQQPILLRQLGKFNASVPQNEVPRLFAINNKTYLISDTVLLEHNVVKMDLQQAQIPIKGYTGIKRVLKAYHIPTKDDQNIRFFAISEQDIVIYEFISQRQVKQVGRIQDLPDNNTRLYAATQQNSYFYVTSLNKLFVIDWTNINKPKISFALMNGSCSEIEKYKTTLHLTCYYRRIVYIAEFFVLGGDVQINRYYGADDVKGRSVVKRIGMGKMAILSDNEIKILGHSLNRKVLEQQDDLQPIFSFGLKSTINFFPIKLYTTKTQNPMILVQSDKVVFIMFEQTPPQLYCEFPSDSIGASYQFLLQFNTSRCSYINSEDDLFYGSLESVCEISIPITLSSKQLQLQQKHANVIMITGFVILGVILLVIISCVIKYNRSLENRFHSMQKKLEKLKKGYDMKKADQIQLNQVDGSSEKQRKDGIDDV